MGKLKLRSQLWVGESKESVEKDSVEGAADTDPRNVGGESTSVEKDGEVVRLPV